MSSLLAEKTEARPNPRQEEAAHAKGVSLTRRRAVTFTRGLAGVLTLALVWELAPRLGLVDPYFIPPLHVVLQEWWSMVVSGERRPSGWRSASGRPVGMRTSWAWRGRGSGSRDKGTGDTTRRSMRRTRR